MGTEKMKKLYTVLLVDDEEEVIQVIMKKIDWEEIGFSVIGYAGNGVRALEMIEESQPDVVMTDIKMPYMNGIELSEHIRREYPATKILIFTGFDEFEYAKEAIRMGVEEYLLKPVSSAELTNVFAQIKLKLDQEISEKRNVAVLQEYYMESLPFLQANFYTTLIEGKIREEEIPKYLSDYQISLDGPYFCCLVIHTSASRVPEDMNFLLLSTAVQKQVQERIGKKWQAKSFSYMEDTVLIIQLKNENELAEVTDECDRFCKYAQRIIGAVVTVGIGQLCGSLMEFSKSYSGAREAVSYRALYGATRAINIQEIAPQEAEQIDYTDDTELSNLFKKVRFGSEEDVKEAVHKCMESMFPAVKSLLWHHVAVMELVSAMYKFASSNDITIEEFQGDMGALYNRLIKREPEMLEKWLVDTSLALRESLISTRSHSSNSFVSKAKEYVHNNYADEEVSLNMVAEVFGVSNSYFSTVFKKETGESFIGYLTDYRMEQAARLLIETNEKSYIIGKKVGYTDPNYFSYVFKRQFGVSPSKYRTEHSESEA